MDGMDNIDLEGAEHSLDAYEVREIEAAAKQDLNFLAGLCIPDVYQFPFPDFFVWLWTKVTEAALATGRSIDHLALGIPRGHAKTTWLKILIVFIVLFTNRRYVLIIGNSAARAEAILADVEAILDSYNIQQVFGNWRANASRIRQSEKVFHFRGRNIVLHAAGQGTSIRGTSQNFQRPDVILFDDAQSAEEAASQAEAESFEQWFWGTVYKAKDPFRCLFIYLGNMYPDKELRREGSHITYCCMLRNLQLNPDWTSFITGAILEDGTALWEDLQPLEQLLTEYRQDRSSGRSHIFYAEVLNDPNPNISSHVDVNQFLLHEDSPVHQFHEGSYITLDPATSKKTPDQFVISYTEIIDGIPHVQELIAEKLSSPQAVWRTLNLAVEKQCGLIIVESNAFQYSLVEWFDFIIAQMKLQGIQIIPHHNSTQKNSRILGIFKELVGQKLSLNKRIAGKVIAQALEFDPRVTDNIDDILDCIQMAYTSYIKYRGAIASALADNVFVNPDGAKHRLLGFPTTPYLHY